MQIKDIIQLLEELAPLKYSEDFDNTGLLIGNVNTKLTGVLVTLDTLESIVDEAIKNDCNLIVSFHPIIFSGLKKITNNTYVERTVTKAIKNDIAIFAIHTALDNAWNGVNAMICKKIGLTNREILIPQSGSIQKLTTYVPVKAARALRESLFEVGAGSIGNYSNCSFNLTGEGSFHGNEDSNPTIGSKGATHYEEEVQIGITFQKHLKGKVINTLLQNHPYEEVAYEVTTLENTNQHIGMGMIGRLSESISEEEFLAQLKTTFHCGVIKHSKFLSKKIEKVAVLGGSGSFAISAAKAAGADAYVTSDLKYHDFFAAEGQILLADIGHYESEQFTKELLVSFLTKKITNFAPPLSKDRVVLSQIDTNPISYY